MSNLFPKRAGLYRPEFEHDSCGNAFVCDISNRPSHKMLMDGAEILENLVHRGAVGANPTTGDGAGMLMQIPHELYRQECEKYGAQLPASGRYSVGMVFLPQNDALRARAETLLENCLREEGLAVLCWRDVPVANSHLNDEVRASEPVVRQVFVGSSADIEQHELDLKVYIARRMFEHAARGARLDDDPAGLYLPSMSSRIVVYKGMFLADQLMPYYGDLTDSRAMSALALVHQRFSTNTFPSWSLAHPYRTIAHNGEINTVRGNINNMLARQGCISSSRLSGIERIFPLLDEGLSDTGTFDSALELLLMCGYKPAQAMTMMIPEAWQGNKMMSAERRAYYKHHAAMLEPWDGPALIAFTDGRQIGALLDRNGLRPARYIETADGRVVMASEAGVLRVPDKDIRRKWRLEPGRMLLIDLAEGKLVSDDEAKDGLARARPFQSWVKNAQIPLASLPDCLGEADEPSPDPEELLRSQQAFGYTKEDLKFILGPMVTDAKEPVGSMGDDAPAAVLSNRPRVLSSYFRQEFAQVTNPAIDPIREDLVMATNTYLGRRPDLLSCNAEPEHKMLALDTPVLSPQEMDRIRNTGVITQGEIVSHVIDITFASKAGPAGMEQALRQLCDVAEDLARSGASILILSDRSARKSRVAIPALLAVSAVHHRLIGAGVRATVGLVADTASAKSVQDFAVLAGFGAEAVCPYLAYHSIFQLRLSGAGKFPQDERLANYRTAVDKGLRKVMSKMGVSTYMSFCGAQLFEALGLGEELVEKYFCRTVSQIGGIGVAEIARESFAWHAEAYGGYNSGMLDEGGEFAFRERGERHLWTPTTVAKLQHAVRANRADTYAEYADLINLQSRSVMTLRGMLRIRELPAPIPVEETETAAELVRRFSTGAMSFGSISHEAHTTLAIAMNRIGGKSNTGEGGEDPERYVPMADGGSMRSAIKQVASGRFGVTAEYLANSDMMQIKIAQGAKPGEGGQLPGYKVDRNIAKTRFSVPGVGLISPPPHHDIYSIEDIAQLIHDLKNVNPDGAVSVKLVSRFGVGTVAAGVAKAKSDHITIAGHDGGTGASPLSSIKFAGTPWELGLAETHQTLVMNDLRGRVSLQVDGQIKTGRDVVIGALLGADEFGFATAPLVAEGCLMMRKCHLNTCPVGIATQDERLRRKFSGKPEHVVNFFFFVAEEVRALMAKMGFRKFNELIGRSDFLEFERPEAHWKARHLDLSAMTKQPSAPAENARHNCAKQDHGLHMALDTALLPQLEQAISGRAQKVVDIAINNGNRTFGTMISGKVAKLHGHAGLPDDSITIRATGSAGQSLGAFLARGVTLDVVGDTNDYCGKGLSGGIISVRPPDTNREDGLNIIVGNVCLYGATAGESYFRGVAGERFCVRNSGATAVVEGAGDHCCEYMTGGTVVVCGPVGRNFAAGMSGGVAYVRDEEGTFVDYCNTEMVDVVPLSHEAHPAAHLRRADTDILRECLSRHYRRTKSPLAASMLKDWNTTLSMFVKVMPREYGRALAELAEEEMPKAIAARA